MSNFILKLQSHTKVIDVLTILESHFEHYDSKFYRNCIFQLQYKSFLSSL